MAIKKLRNTTQKGDIEEYLTEFKGWANLAGFNNVALVNQFKTGLKKGLGRQIMETGNPGDGTTPGQLQEWYQKALELERAYREAEQHYGKKEFTGNIPNHDEQHFQRRNSRRMGRHLYG
jgi:hypothetical protein